VAGRVRGLRATDNGKAPAIIKRQPRSAREIADVAIELREALEWLPDNR
jgi:hypothetical protein